MKIEKDGCDSGKREGMCRLFGVRYPDACDWQTPLAISRKLVLPERARRPRIKRRPSTGELCETKETKERRHWTSHVAEYRGIVDATSPAVRLAFGNEENGRSHPRTRSPR